MDTKTLLKLINFYARFTPSYTKLGMWVRRLSWPKAPPLDAHGQRWLVTGASTGLGKAMMQAAAQAGAEVLAISSSKEKLDAAVAELPADQASRVTVVAADLSLVSGTQALLDDLLARGQKFDVIQNNAGMLFRDLNVTSEGREASYVINVLSHFQLTTGLVENGMVNNGGVIVNMTSGGMYNAPLGIAGLNTTDAAAYNGKVSYAYAKRAQVALTDYWNALYADREICAYVTHPGWSKTPGVKQALPTFWKIQNLILRTPLQGADTALWLCAARPEVQNDVVWFDRSARPTHMYDFTRTPQCTIEELVAHFQSDLAGEAAAGNSE